MRNECDIILSELASTNTDIYLVVADLGGFKKFRLEHSKQFINVGVAESNSVGIAAGLASDGKMVFLHTVAGFTLYRAFEQIKFSIGYWRKPICIMGTGFGWQYHMIGRGHHTPDDLLLMQLIPNMEIYSPYSYQALCEAISNFSVPRYIRLGESINDIDMNIKNYGDDILIVVLGSLGTYYYEVYYQILKIGVDVGYVVIEHLNKQIIKDIIGNHNGKLVVIEDHIKLGGLGSFIENIGRKIDLHFFLPINVEKICGTKLELLTHYQLDIDSVTKKILTLF